MKKLIFLFFFMSFLIFSTISKAQNKAFTEDSVKYMAEIEDLFSADKRMDKKDVKEYIEKFQLEWFSGHLSTEHRKLVYEMSNKMAQKRLYANPYFKNYLDAVMAYIHSGKNIAFFQNWHNILEKLLEDRTNKFNDFLEISITLFEENTLFESNSTKWTSNNDNYRLEFDGKLRIIFPNLILTGYAKGDSTKIFNTQGVYYPLEKLWLGEGGIVTWERAGFGESDVFAKLNFYTIAFQYSQYKIDSVEFYNNEVFAKPIIGELNEKILADITTAKATYPRFVSYDKRLSIENLFQDIDYEGGFSMHGGKVIGSGDEEKPAVVTYKLNNKPFIIAKSTSFLIEKDRIISDKADVSIKLSDEDSIYHPQITMRYLNNRRQVFFLRSEEGIGASPFYNTYHNLDLYPEAITWKIGAKTVDFEASKGFREVNESNFESSTYFSEFRFEKLQGLSYEHPLFLIRKYSKANNTNEIPLDDFAHFTGIPHHELISILTELTKLGLVRYLPEKRKAIILDKLMHYILSYSMGPDNNRLKYDYDVIQFESKLKGNDYGKLLLDSLDMELQGIEMVTLSDSQGVFIYPHQQKITIKKNRDFAFEGKIVSGLFTFYGKEFFFNYDAFKIDLNNTDSLRFKVKSDDLAAIKSGGYREVRTVLEAINGELLIDEPDNKSGMRHSPHYPIFKSNSESYVYYNRDFTQNGVYNAEDFKFLVKPFTIDSLDNTSTEGISFNGDFISAGIFPRMSDSLVVMEDYSLGMRRKTGPRGYPTYIGKENKDVFLHENPTGKGQYYEDVYLSYEGLKAEGYIEYITATIKSEEFVLMPDSTVAEAYHFDIQGQKSGVQYPNVIGKNVHQLWRPYKDKMSFYKKREPIDIFDGKSLFHGRLDYTPHLLTGDGIMAFNDARLSSDFFKYKYIEFDADSADLQLDAIDSDELALRTSNYKSHVDFNEYIGNFRSNDAESLIEFPLNQYISYMDEFDWYIKDKNIKLRNTKVKDHATLDQMPLRDRISVKLPSNFVSVNIHQDSINFFSANADYSLHDNIIFANDVKYIKIADAAIIPNEGKVTIEKNAIMSALKKAEVVADTSLKFHIFYDGYITISSRHKYFGRAYLDYIDKNHQAQKIYFIDINVDSLTQTYARAEIKKGSNLALSPYFDFYGNIHLKARERWFNYSGGVALKHNCSNIEKKYMEFTSVIIPDSMYFPVPDEPKEYLGRSVYSGIHMAKDTTNILSTFLGDRHSFSDTVIVTANGYLTFVEGLNQYRIGSLEKLNDRDSVAGNYLSFDIDHCEVYGEGEMNLGLNFGQINTKTWGKGFHNANSDNAEFQVLLMLDFFFPEKALKVMEDDFLAAGNLTGINYLTNWFRKSLILIVGKKEADKILEDYALYGNTRKLPDAFENTLVFTDLKLKWENSTNSYKSTEKIGLGNILSTQINKYMEGKIQFERKRSRHNFDIYLDLGNGSWYYFNFNNNLLSALSSNQNFNDIITGIKPEDRVLDTEPGQQPYSFTLATDRRKSDFLRNFDNK